MRKVSITAAAVAAMFAWAGSARAEQGELTAIGNLPAAVKNAADKAAGNPNWLLSYRFKNDRPNDGKAWYRLVGRDAKKRLMTAEVYATGKVGAVLTDVGIFGLPMKADTSIRAKYFGFVQSEVWAVGEDVTKVLCYKVKGKDLNGKQRTIYVSPDGKKVVDG
jgi:hypothetical protein